MSDLQFSYYVKDSVVYVQFFDAWWEVKLMINGSCFIPVRSKHERKITRKKRNIRDYD